MNAQFFELYTIIALAVCGVSLILWAAVAAVSELIAFIWEPWK